MELTRENVDQALAGDRGAMRLVIDALTPVIQVRVARVLLRHRAGRPAGAIRQEVEDMTQDAFVALFENDGRVLRAWDPAKGLSLRNFVGLVAERHVLSSLRTAKRNPWTEEPLDSFDALSDALSKDEPEPLEVEVASRELLERVADGLRQQLTPLGMHLFNLLFVQQEPVEAVCASVQMTPSAVYAWRSRLGKHLRSLVRTIMSEEPSPQRSPQRGRA